jgi:hypothetical protein
VCGGFAIGSDDGTSGYVVRVGTGACGTLARVHLELYGPSWSSGWVWADPPLASRVRSQAGSGAFSNGGGGGGGGAIAASCAMSWFGCGCCGCCNCACGADESTSAIRSVAHALSAGDEAAASASAAEAAEAAHPLAWPALPWHEARFAFPGAPDLGEPLCVRLYVDGDEGEEEEELQQRPWEPLFVGVEWRGGGGGGGAGGGAGSGRRKWLADFSGQPVAVPRVPVAAPAVAIALPAPAPPRVSSRPCFFMLCRR